MIPSATPNIIHLGPQLQSLLLPPLPAYAMMFPRPHVPDISELLHVPMDNKNSSNVNKQGNKLNCGSPTFQLPHELTAQMTDDQPQSHSSVGQLSQPYEYGLQERLRAEMESDPGFQTSCCLVVSSLSPDVTSSDLEQFFNFSVGEKVRAKIIHDESTLGSQHCALIACVSAEACNKILAKPRIFHDRTLHIELAHSGSMHPKAVDLNILFVGNLAECIHEDTVKFYFEKYGEILSVCFFKNQSANVGCKNALVTFTNQVAVDRVLIASLMHVIGASFVSVAHFNPKLHTPGGVEVKLLAPLHPKHTNTVTDKQPKHTQKAPNLAKAGLKSTQQQKTESVLHKDDNLEQFRSLDDTNSVLDDSFLPVGPYPNDDCFEPTMTELRKERKKKAGWEIAPDEQEINDLLKELENSEIIEDKYQNSVPLKEQNKGTSFKKVGKNTLPQTMNGQKPAPTLAAAPMKTYSQEQQGKTPTMQQNKQPQGQGKSLHSKNTAASTSSVLGSLEIANVQDYQQDNLLAMNKTRSEGYPSRSELAVNTHKVVNHGRQHPTNYQQGPPQQESYELNPDLGHHYPRNRADSANIEPTEAHYAYSEQIGYSQEHPKQHYQKPRPPLSEANYQPQQLAVHKSPTAKHRTPFQDATRSNYYSEENIHYGSPHHEYDDPQHFVQGIHHHQRHMYQQEAIHMQYPPHEEQMPHSTRQQFQNDFTECGKPRREMALVNSVHQIGPPPTLNQERQEYYHPQHPTYPSDSQFYEDDYPAETQHHPSGTSAWPSMRKEVFTPPMEEGYSAAHGYPDSNVEDAGSQDWSHLPHPYMSTSHPHETLPNFGKSGKTRKRPPKPPVTTRAQLNGINFYKELQSASRDDYCFDLFQESSKGGGPHPRW